MCSGILEHLATSEKEAPVARELYSCYISGCMHICLERQGKGLREVRGLVPGHTANDGQAGTMT